MAADTDDFPNVDDLIIASETSHPSPDEQPRRRRGRRPLVLETVQTVQNVTEDAINRASRGRKPTGWSAEDQEVIQLAIATLLILSSDFFARSMDDHEYRLHSEEAEAIAKPAVRILLRHVRFKAGKGGDMADALALITAVTAYGMRCYNLYVDKKQAEKAGQDA